MEGISNTVCRMPVTNPAAIPARVATARAATGFLKNTATGFMDLFKISMAHTQPPRAKLPSTVRSAMSSSL